MAGQLKLGLDLSGQTLYVYTDTALTMPTTTTTVLETSGGYSIVGTSASYILYKPSGTRTLYTANAKVNYSLTLDDDVGFITSINDSLGFLDIITRNDNVRVYGFTEDGVKVGLPRLNSPTILDIESGSTSIEGNSYAVVEYDYPISNLGFTPKLTLLNGITTNHQGSLGINAFSVEISGNYIICKVVLRNFGSSARTGTVVTWNVTVM